MTWKSLVPRALATVHGVGQTLASVVDWQVGIERVQANLLYSRCLLAET